jgi:TldD protein
MTINPEQNSPRPSGAIAKLPSLLHGGALNETGTQSLVNDVLAKADDGELFLEYKISESLSFDDGRLKLANRATMQGFGLRAVKGDFAAYAHSADISDAALKRAASTVRAISNAPQKNVNAKIAPAFNSNIQHYAPINPLDSPDFSEKLEILQEIDAYLRAADSRVKQVSASLAASVQQVEILRINGESASDVRPLVRLSVQVVLEDKGRMEAGSSGTGGRVGFEKFISNNAWKKLADEALRQASVNMESIPAPAGEFPVVLGPGWCGVLLHEAVGHGLEGDFNRKGASTFSGRIGEQVAAKGVSVVDDGTIADRRGSLNIDDEGTPSARNVLIEDGILKNYIQDRMNARLMDMKATGNGRRESYAHTPLPRMTNTFMLSGSHQPEEMIKSIQKGVYMPYLGGGQVDITSGKFVFNATEAYLIEDGKVTAPLKGATLIGSGPDIMQKITMIGDDSCMDPGIGTCGKDGQSVPVGVGQPSLKISAITIGGTAV